MGRSSIYGPKIYLFFIIISIAKKTTKNAKKRLSVFLNVGMGANEAPSRV